MAEEPSIRPEQRIHGERFLPWSHVRELAGFSRTTAWRLQQAGEFPKPVRISPGRVGWRQSELDAWQASRSSQSMPAPPMPRSPGRRPKASLTKAVETIRATTGEHPRQGQPMSPRTPAAGGQIAFDF